MKKERLILTISFCLFVGTVICQDVEYYYSAAKKALDHDDPVGFYSNIIKAYELHPYNQNILWHAGVAACLNNRPEESIGFLRRAININAGYDLNDSNLISLKNTKAFLDLVDTKKRLSTPVVQSDTAYVILDRQLHLESVAFDPIANALYCGSIHKQKIIKIRDDGSVSDFTTTSEHNLGSVFGLKVDERKRTLWACTSPMPEMQHFDSSMISTLYQFDIASRKLLDYYQPADSVTNHIFGDLVLNSKGEPFVSDSRNNVVYRIHAASGKLVPFFTSKEFWNIQGLAFSDDDKLLYISDYVKGIFLLNTQTMLLRKVEAPYDLSLKGTDGIIFFKNSLVTLQNGVQPNRVVRHFLNEAGTAFIRYNFIDNAHPAFGEPTIGSQSGHTLYYVANSQWNGYENGKIKAASQLQPGVILKYTLQVGK